MFRLHNRKALRFITDPVVDAAGAGSPAAPEADPATGADAGVTDPPAGGTVEETGETEVEGLSDMAKAELARARKEAAGYRTRLREAEAALTKASTPEEVAEVRRELTEKNALLERTILVDRAAREHSLPQDLADLLVGNTADELTAHAKRLAALVVAPPADSGDPSGGLDPRSSAQADVRASVQKALKRRY